MGEFNYLTYRLLIEGTSWFALIKECASCRP